MLRLLARHWVCLAALGLAAGGCAAATDYQEGIKAFRAGDFAAALALFEAAARAGNHSDELRYNIAVSRYKLGDYAGAERDFRALLQAPQWRQLARFNLGLVAERRGDSAAAIRWYSAVAADAGEVKLQALAQAGLNRLQAPAAAPATPRKWLALLSAGVGYDSNAASLASALQSSSSAASDSFAESMAYGQYDLDGARLYALAYGQRYQDYGDLDISTYLVGGDSERAAPWGHTDLGALAARIYIGSDLLADQLQVKFGWRSRDAARQWSVTWLPAYFAAGDRYRQVDGWQQRLEAGWRGRFSAMTLKAVYRFEWNRRDDLRLGDNFYSYSPTRHSLSLEAVWTVLPGWQITAGGDYIHSRYRGTNRLPDIDGVFKVKTRESNQLVGSLSTVYFITSRWHLTGRLQYTDNRDNFDLYTYDKREARVGVEYQY